MRGIRIYSLIWFYGTPGKEESVGAGPPQTCTDVEIESLRARVTQLVRALQPRALCFSLHHTVPSANPQEGTFTQCKDHLRVRATAGPITHCTARPEFLGLSTTDMIIFVVGPSCVV